MAKLFVSTKDESVRMFKSDFFELFSKVHYSVPLFVFLPVIGYCVYTSYSIGGISILEQLLYLFLGFFVWTFTEYFLHRFVFHYQPPTKIGERIHFVVHGVHHDYPNDSKRLVMPPILSIPLALLFFVLFKWILPASILYIFFTGFILGYLIYDMMHYAIHHAKVDNVFWRQIQEHHLRHHFKDPNKGYGVSSDLWDRIIGSNFPKKSRNSSSAK